MAIRMKLFVIDYSRLLSHVRRGGCERILKRLERCIAVEIERPYSNEHLLEETTTAAQ